MNVQAPALSRLAEAAHERDLAAARVQSLVMEAASNGASQREIARALGVSQSAVSQMITSSRAKSVIFSGPVGQRLLLHRAEVMSIVKTHGASNVRVFGSVARGDDSEGSDVDLLVSMPPTVGLFGLAGLEIELEDLLGVPVDVVPEQMVKSESLAALAASAIAL